jgi:hypothetical protein
MAATWGEMFPPTPSFTEKEMTNQEGRVFIVTGGSAGIGYEGLFLLIPDSIRDRHRIHCI